MKKLHLFLCLLPLWVVAGCHDMWEQASYRPLEPNRQYADDASARPLVAGVVAREDPRQLTTFDTGRSGENYTNTMPVPVTSALLKRGQERFNVYCAPCHGFDGYGHGIVVRRGFPAPPSYHSERLRQAPIGHFFDVMTNGYGAMYSYADRVKPADRWAIAAYIRALQRSQNASESDVPQAKRNTLETAP